MNRGWRSLFTLEIAICLVTVVLWALAPWDFLSRVYGAPQGSLSHYLLLQQAGTVVFCAYVYLYARMLFTRPFNLVSFRHLQEAMAIGDAILVASAPATYRALHPDGLLFGAQTGTAALWLTIRVVFLLRVRDPDRTAPGSSPG